MVLFKVWKNSDQVLGLIHFMCSSLLILPSGPEGQLSRALLLASIIQSCSVVCLKHRPRVVSLKNGDYCCDQRTLLEITCVVRIITGITTCQHLFSVFPSNARSRKHRKQLEIRQTTITVATVANRSQKRFGEVHLLLRLKLCVCGLMSPPERCFRPPA